MVLTRGQLGAYSLLCWLQAGCEASASVYLCGHTYAVVCMQLPHSKRAMDGSSVAACSMQVGSRAGSVWGAWMHHGVGGHVVLYTPRPALPAQTLAGRVGGSGEEACRMLQKATAGRTNKTSQSVNQLRQSFH